MPLIVSCGSLNGSEGAASIAVTVTVSGENENCLTVTGVPFTEIESLCGCYVGELPTAFPLMDLGPNCFCRSGDGTVTFGFMPSEETESTVYSRELFAEGTYECDGETLTVQGVVPFIFGDGYYLVTVTGK